MNPTLEPSNLQLLKQARQMLLVVAENEHTHQAQIGLWSKGKENWQLHQQFQAVCGERGMAWGLGIPLEVMGPSTPSKTEGDRKTPVGIFTMGRCMGYAPQLAVNPQWPYRRITETMQGVDDLNSQFYNQVVDLADPETEPLDWNSYEVMLRPDSLYKWLLVIEHNPYNIPGAGSLIFLHLWESPEKGTAGCIAVAETTMLEILRWLNPNCHPAIVMLTREMYPQLSEHWGLPQL